MKTILAAADFSAGADVAARQAAELARVLGAKLVLLHVAGERMHRPAPAPAVTAAIASMRDLAREHRRASGLQAEHHLAFGSRRGTVVEFAARTKADLIVLGSLRRGPVADLAAGAWTKRLLRRAMWPVLVPRRAEAGPYRRVLAAIDTSPEAVEVLRAADALAGGRPLDLLHVHTDPLWVTRAFAGTTSAELRLQDAIAQARCRAHLAAIVRRARPRCGMPNVVGTTGEPHLRILEVAEQLGADLVALGTTTHRMGAIARFMMGSTAERVITRAGCDVVAVPLPLRAELDEQEPVVRSFPASLAGARAFAAADGAGRRATEVPHAL